jgi:hypothetical protein
MKAWPVIAWSAVFVLFGGLLYKRIDQIHQLEAKRDRLQCERSEQMARREALAIQLQYQDDPAAIELALLERLGLSPEGWTKVYFAPPGDPLSSS